MTSNTSPTLRSLKTLTKDSLYGSTAQPAKVLFSPITSGQLRADGNRYRQRCSKRRGSNYPTADKYLNDFWMPFLKFAQESIQICPRAQRGNDVAPGHSATTR